MRLSNRMKAASAVVALAIAGGVAWGVASADQGIGIALMEGEPRVPADTPAEWVTYADAVVVARVTAERDTISVSEAESDENGGYQPREVTLSVVSVIWKNELLPNATTPIPPTLTLQASGALVEDGQATPAAIEGSPRLAIDHTYIMPIGKFASSGTWEIINSTAVLPYDDGTVGIGEWEGSASRTLSPSDLEAGSVAVKALGGTAATVSQTLSSAKPVDGVEIVGDPDSRWQQVVARNDASTEPDPLPSGSETPGDDSTVVPDTE